tara:strand:- start:876 stop:1358 length:483 start_codon:yes stop_codon:yes gene_type:complete
MPQYKITKARLSQIIKEEYQSLHEANPLMQNINRWSEEGEDIPLDQTVGRADRSDQLDAILSSTRSDIGNLQDVISYFVMKADAADVQKWLDERGLMGGPGASAYNRSDEAKKPDFLDLDKDGDEDESFEKAEKDKKEKKVKKESLDSIRDLIQQELQNL